MDAVAELHAAIFGIQGYTLSLLPAPAKLATRIHVFPFTVTFIFVFAFFTASLLPI